MYEEEEEQTLWTKIAYILGYFWRYESPLQPESAYTFNDDCNELEFDCIGNPVARTAEELGIITEWENGADNVMDEEIVKRHEVNVRREYEKKESTFTEFNCWSKRHVMHLLNGFSILDENDDMIIDSQEFINALIHFEDNEDNLVDEMKESKIFNFMDKNNDGFLDVKQFLTLCQYVEGIQQAPASLAADLSSSSFQRYIVAHNLLANTDASKI